MDNIMFTNHTAIGLFEVTLTPQPHVDGVGDPAIGRMSIDKQFSGDLRGTSRGQMIAAMSEVKGSAGYVAMERVEGTLHGRRGAVTLQHTGIMTRGTPQLTITVVPDSGTGELAGISGTMTIDIIDGQHHYVLAYALPDAS
jgi:hypothetical protein